MYQGVELRAANNVHRIHRRTSYSAVGSGGRYDEYGAPGMIEFDVLTCFRSKIVNLLRQRNISQWDAWESGCMVTEIRHVGLRNGG